MTGTHISESQRDTKFLRKKHDDWIHCDYPSQCHQRRQQLRTKVSLGELDASDAFDADSYDGDEWVQAPSMTLNPDDELEMNEPIELREGEKEWLKMLNSRISSPVADGSTLNDEEPCSMVDSDGDGVN